MSELLGLGKAARQRLSQVLRRTKGTITAKAVAETLHISRLRASQLLAGWARRGWLRRIKQGIYVSVPLDATTSAVGLENVWTVATEIFSPCYIGGWTAANHWDLTEQIFNTVVVFSIKTVRDRQPVVGGIPFLIRTISAQRMFGLQTEWRDTAKILISDPTRTVVDIFNHITIGGGLNQSIEIFKSYLDSKHRDLEKLLSYAKKMDNKAIFKRLGYLLEKLEPDAKEFVKFCQANLSSGYAKLDLTQKDQGIVTKWKLWIPRRWKEPMFE